MGLGDYSSDKNIILSVAWIRMRGILVNTPFVIVGTKKFAIKST
jgi:hypothetical protein